LIFEMARTSLAASGLPRKFWVEAVKNAVFIRNRLPDTNGVSPFEKLHGRAPSIAGLYPLGCFAYMLQHDHVRRKLDDKSVRCVLQSNLEHGNYRLLETSTDKVHVSRHVVFDERVFPARRQEPEGVAGSGPPVSAPDVEFMQRSVDNGEHQEHIPVDVSGSETEDDADPSTASDSTNVPEELQNVQDSGETPASDEEQVENVEDTAEEDEIPHAESSASAPRYPSRNRRPPGTWWAFNTDVGSCHLRSGTQQLAADAEQTCHVRKAVEESDSPTLKQALSSPSRDMWEVAIAEELESLREAGTWDDVEQPHGVKIFPSRFVSKVKRHSDGFFERRKARLVLMGNLQRPNIDYFDTYAPVADFVVVRIVLAMACAKQWVVHQLDVKSAFLNGFIAEDI
jgi:hypothetical protein